MKKLLLLTIVVLIAHNGFCQLECANWIFGDHGGISFNQSSRQPFDYSGMNLNNWGYTSTISTKDGDLLFYTNGYSVYDNQEVQLFTGLVGQPNGNATNLIIRKPDSINVFYIFTVNVSNDLYYSILRKDPSSYSFTLYNSEKGILLLSDAEDKIAGTIHSNNTDYWIGTRKENTDEYYIFLLTKNGISLGNSYSSNPFNSHQGNMKFSPDGSKMAAAICEGHFQTGFIEVWDFDKSTGILSNQKVHNEFGGDVEFSPSGGYLYYNTIDNPNYMAYIKRIDLSSYSGNIFTTVNTILSLPTLSTNYIPGGCSLGLDHKIYLIKKGSSYLDVINYPDNLNNVGYVSNAIYMNNGTSIDWMCNFPSNYFYNECIYNNRYEVSFTYDNAVINQDNPYKEEITAIDKYGNCNYLLSGAITDQTDKIYGDIISLNEYGDINWNKLLTLGQNYSVKINDIKHTNDNNIIACGYILDNSIADANKDFFIIKMKDDGTILWEKYSNLWFDDELFEINENVDGYYAVGYTNFLGTTTIYVITLGEDGSVIESRSFMESQKYYGGVGTSIQAIDNNGDNIADNGFIVTGYYENFAGNTGKDIFIFQLEKNCDFKPGSAYSFPIQYDQEGVRIKQQLNYGRLQSGRYTLVGNFEYLNGANIDKDMFFIEIKEKPTLSFVYRRIGSINDEFVSDFVQIDDLNYVLTGKLISNNQEDIFLHDITKGGIYGWTKKYGSSSFDDYALAIESDAFKGEILFAGATKNYSTNNQSYDYLVSSVDFSGNSSCYFQPITFSYQNTLPQEPVFLNDYGYIPTNIEDASFTLLNYSPDRSDCNGAIPPSIMNSIDIPEDNKVSIYPNPAFKGDELFISIPIENFSNVNIRIIDNLGKVVSFSQVKENVKIINMNIKDLSTGSYIIQIEIDNKAYYNKLLIK